ncbi:hypothetical protein GF343_03790 [Candidatus Woesearchaeota archaeon]|nr:hypothetical protein [Candidatus Woesearchaeota archaeon]
MGKYTEKKKVKEALKKAKELEKEHIMTPKQELGVQKEAATLSEKLQNLLKPAWFIKDVHKKKAVKKAKKKAKKKSGQKKKKKRAGKKTHKKKVGKQTTKKKK